ERADRHVAPAVAVEVPGIELLAPRVTAIDAVDEGRRQRWVREVDRRRPLAALTIDDVRLADLARQMDGIADVVRSVAAARALAVAVAGRADLRGQALEPGVDQYVGGAVVVEVERPDGRAAVIARIDAGDDGHRHGRRSQVDRRERA